MNLGSGMWMLDPSVIYLNHGSLGSCPIPVLDAQQAFRTQMERRPIEFVLRQMQDRMADVRLQLGALIGADGDDLALVPNATVAVNTVLRSLDLRPGDEIVVTNHEYNACLNAVDFVAARSGAKVVQAVVPYPLSDPSQVVDAITAVVGPRTRLALVCHVTSATGIIFPIERIVAELDRRGVDVLVDGAHGTALLDLDLDGIGAAYYAATCHKWLGSPKGTGYLHVRRDRQAGIRPLVISHGTNDPRTEIPLFRREFDWQGTHDLTPFLAMPVAISTMSGLLDGGLPALRQRNHELAIRARDMLCEVFETAPPVPDSTVSAMASVPLNMQLLGPMGPETLQVVLRERHRIEVPIMQVRLDKDAPGQWMIRVSCQIYNDDSDIQALRAGLVASFSH